MTPATKAKAVRLADEGRVKMLIGAEVLAVQGDHDVYLVCATTDEDRRAREDQIEREECERLAREGGMFA